MKILLSLSLCLISSLFGFKPSAQQQEAALSMDEIRLELADLKHALHVCQVDLRIAEEKLKNQESTIASLKKEQSSKQGAKVETSSFTLSALEKKVDKLEKMQEKTVADLHQLNSYAHQTTAKIEEFSQDILEQSSRLNEVVKLKSTLHSLSKAMNQNSAQSSSESGSGAYASSNSKIKTYKVKSGDSLGTIANRCGIKISELKQINHLSSDKITVNQILKIPADDNP